MKKAVSLLAILFSATLFVVGCKGPVDGLTSINLDPNERVTIQATFENGSGAATIGDLSVTWDGQILQESAAATPIEQVMVSGVRLGRELPAGRQTARRHPGRQFVTDAERQSLLQSPSSTGRG